MAISPIQILKLITIVLMLMSEKGVAVVGAGYVGLPVACALAGAGLHTIVIDIVPERVQRINEGVCPILGDEPGLAGLLARTVEEGRLVASTEISKIRNAGAILVCVDTPISESTKKPNLDALQKAVQSIGENMSIDTLASIESTIPPLTMKNLVIPILEQASGLRAGKEFSVVHCPERVMPGRLLSNLANYERVLGGLDKHSIELGTELYSNIVHAKIHPTDLLSAEMTKTLENAYRDVQIAFANEVALACEELGADAFEVRRLVNTCPFRDMHLPGSGVGGHCLPKDSWLFASSLKETKLEIITAAREVNEFMPYHMIELVERALNEAGIELLKARIAILGLAFLRDSDDTRHSPAITIIDGFAGRVDELTVHDPFVQNAYKAPLVRQIETALTDADCMVIVTDHSCYSSMDLEWFCGLMRTPIIVDGRNVLIAEDARSIGFRYIGLGKGN